MSEKPITGVSSENERSDSSLNKNIHNVEKTDFPVDAETQDVLKHITNSIDHSFTDEDLEIIAAHLHDRSLEESIEILRKAVIEHAHDPSVEKSKLELLTQLCEGPLPGQFQEEWESTVKFEAFLIYEWSIYPEVRAATRPIEDKEEACETFRVYFLGILYACAGSCLCTFFNNRFPTISITTGAIQLLLAGSGKAWGSLPKVEIPLGFGRSFKLNPGVWTFKEQMLSTLAVSCALGSPYSQWTITAQANEQFYGFTDGGFGYMTMLTLSSQMMGFGVAGLMRSFLVYPEICVWYTTLPTIVLNRSLVKSEERVTYNGWNLLRWEAFTIFAIFSFIWYWVTNFLFSALSVFAWPTWIAPDNVNLQALTGASTGLALNPISTFDWNNMDQAGMVTPFFSTANQFFGTFIGFIAIVIIWYTNTSYAAHLPINTNSLFANDGTRFSVRKLLDSKGNLDEEKYQAYSLPFYSAGNLVVYGSFFMVYPAMIVYAILNYGVIIVDSCKNFWKSLTRPGTALKLHNDRFTRAQRKYNEVPEWWFLIVLLCSFGMAVATVEVYKFTNTPVWTIAFGALLSTIFTIPFGLLYAMTNLQIEINVLIELIIGYALPGNGNALMVSKTYATQFNTQTDNYITNQASAHYTGIPPRALFRVQMLSVILVSFVQVGIIFWQLNGGIADMCSPTNSQKFICAGSRTFFNAGVLWGTIGPKRVFEGLYPKMKYCFLIGCFVPIPFWAGRRWGPKIHPIFNRLNGVNELLWISGCINWAPYNFMYYWSNFVLAFCFQYVVKRRYPLWWRKYNYIIWSAMRVGLAYAGLIVFFATGYHHVVSLDWWGNTGAFENLDNGTPDYAIRLPVPDVGYFGPAPGNYP